MKIAVLADIHANLEALDAAFETVDAHGAAAVYCLGDIVGYGADPDACLKRVRARCDGVVRGNHDAAVARKEALEALPRDGRAAAEYNRSVLSEEQLSYLAGLPLTLEAHGVRFVHASPDEPAAWKRLTSYHEANTQFEHFEEKICFIGHTHRPAVMANQPGIWSVRAGHRYLINPGSVGQPRDGSPRLSLGIFDTEAFAYENVRAPYNVDRAAEKVRAAGLPERLAERLLKGR